MWEKSNLKRCLVLALLVIVLTLSVWGFMVLRSWLETQDNQDNVDLTPESIVKAFQDTGIEVSSVQSMDTYSGPVLPGEYGIELTALTEGEAFTVSVVWYASSKDAKESASSINRFSRKIGYASYGCAFRRGNVVLITSGKGCRQDMARVFTTVLTIAQ
ncbi:MAG: hypothetical protein GY845_14345 [Planctomycetes bacterium]|nr:hypothetical protein [Planctomycetota bacterium]